MNRFLMNTLALALIAAGSAVAQAQTGTGSANGTRVDLTPSIAYFNPTGNVVDQDGTTAKFGGAAGFGGRLSIWFNEKVAFEGSAHYGRTALEGDYLGDSLGSIDMALFYGSAQIAVALGSEKRFMLHGGIGLQGTNYDELIEGGNIMTGVFGMSGWMPLNETTALRVDLDVHAYTTYFEVGDLRTNDQAQFDMVLAFGVQFSPSGR